MDWRNLIKVGGKKIPLTKAMFESGEIKKGDYVTPTIDMQVVSGQIPFLKDKYYEVLSVFPTIIYLNGEFGKHGIHFESSDGGAAYFYLVNLTDDEKMGIFESIPGDILDLLTSHKVASRRAIIDELLLKYYSKDEEEQAKLKDAVLQSLTLLQRQEYIESGTAMGSYRITDKGRLFRRGKDFTEETSTTD